MNKKNKAKNTVKPETKPLKDYKGKGLTIDRAKLIVSYYIANNCTNKTQALIQAGYSAKTATYNTARIFDNDIIKDELKRQIQPVVAQGQITLINLQNAYWSIYTEIKENNMYRLYAVAKSCLDSLSKTIGAFQADKLPESNVLGKLADAKKAEELNKAINSYYSSKYLAVNPDVKSVESTSKDTDMSTFNMPLDVVSTDFTPDKSIETILPEADPSTPQPPPASSTTSPSFSRDVFSENGETPDGIIGDIGKNIGFDDNGDMVEYGIGDSSQDDGAF